MQLNITNTGTQPGIEILFGFESNVILPPIGGTLKKWESWETKEITTGSGNDNEDYSNQVSAQLII